MLTGMHVVLLVLAMTCAAQDAHPGNKRMEWNFPANGRLEVHVSDADVHVVQGSDGKVAVECKIDPSSAADEVKLDFEVHGESGSLNITQPHDADVTVYLKIPASTDLVLRARAGDIDVETLGSKDVETGAGDVRLVIGTDQQYGIVDVSTQAGDVSGEVCGKPKGWTGRSLHCIGRGKDQVNVHTNAGDVEVRERPEPGAEK